MRALRVAEGRARAYRHVWKGTAVTSFFTPVAFLVALGLGLGTLVDAGDAGRALAGGTYLAFLAPGLLAATTMQTAANECAWPVMAGLKWHRTYDALIATPIAVRDLVIGHLLWTAVRLLMVAAAFAVVMAAFGVSGAGGSALAVAPAVLTGIAFAPAVLAFAAVQDDADGLAALFRFGITPLFLFSGAFFPVSQLPGWLQPVAFATPLWHGVELTRAAVLATVPALAPGWHMAYLAVWAAVGTVVAIRLLGRRLIR